jgi:hypothetical protein
MFILIKIPTSQSMGDSERMKTAEYLKLAVANMVQEGIECMLVNFASELMIGQWKGNNCIVGERLGDDSRTSDCGSFLTNHQFARKSLQACTQSLLAL